MGGGENFLGGCEKYSLGGYLSRPDLPGFGVVRDFVIGIFPFFSFFDVLEFFHMFNQKIIQKI